MHETVLKLGMATALWSLSLVLPPWQKSLSARRNAFAYGRLLLHMQPAAATAIICNAQGPVAIPEKKLVPLIPQVTAAATITDHETPLPLACQADVAWRENGAWQSLCNQPSPEPAAFYAERYYRMQLRCHIQFSIFTGSLPLLEATVFR